MRRRCTSSSRPIAGNLVLTQMSVERPKIVRFGVASDAPDPLCSVYPLTQNNFSFA